ncbi:MAG: phage major capsid protein, partial [Candidatus Hydrothermia bacterium]
IVKAMAFRNEAMLKTLTSGDTPFLPAGVSDEVIKAAERGASVRPGATVHRVSESTGRIPVARPSLTAYWVSEGTEPPDESQPAFTYLAWNANKLKAFTRVTLEALEDNSADIGAEITDSLGRAIRHTEETAFWLGDGSGKPSGIDPAIPSSWVIDATGREILEVLNEIYLKLPVEFRERATWYANSATKALLLGLADTAGRPLLTPSLSEAFPWTIYGRPVREATVLADGDIYLGDMSFYHIFDRRSMEIRVITEDEDLALKDEVLITVTERTDGKLAWDTDGGITPFVKAENLGQ